jgi:hypothetical protein
VKTLETVELSQDWDENFLLGSTGSQFIDPPPIKLSTRSRISHQSVGFITIEPGPERFGRTAPAKFLFRSSPFATMEGVWFGAALDDVGYPGATAASLGDWPRLWQHPESTLALQVITTLITGVGRARLTKSDCWESVYHWISADSEDAKDRFAKLAQVWKDETDTYSDVTEIVIHSAYQRIIGMGAFALPFIFEDLLKESNHWFHALHAITGTNPVPDRDRGDIEQMRRHWLRWGKQNGFA